MRIHRLFLVSFILFIFCIAGVSSTLSQENLPAIVKKVEPSVVVIITYDREGEILVQGSGFFISKDGDVVTSLHVLQGAIRAEVKTADGNVYPVKNILAKDQEGDLIRISVEIGRDTVHPLPVSTSLPGVGERVVVIGSPLGLERTVADGIVSAVREIPAFGKIVQISAPISPGSSGSPVVNMKGEVIAVATFQMVEGQNINFAIPGERVAGLKSTERRPISNWAAHEADEALTLYVTGFLKYGLEDYEGAISNFEEAIQKKPDYAEAYYSLGVCYSELDRYQDEIEAYKQAIRIKPDYAKAHYNLGMCYGELGRYQDGIEAWKQAIRIKPDYAKAHYNLGFCYGELGRYQDGIEALKQAIRIEPDFAEAHCELGVYYDELGRYHEAIEAYKQAIRIEPDFARAHYNLGVCYGELGRYHEAIEAYKQAIRIKPDYAKAHYNLGITYLNLGDTGFALQEYKTLKELDEDLANELFNRIYE